jgi:hypothetical protein
MFVSSLWLKLMLPHKKCKQKRVDSCSAGKVTLQKHIITIPITYPSLKKHRGSLITQIIPHQNCGAGIGTGAGGASFWWIRNRNVTRLRLLYSSSFAYDVQLRCRLLKKISQTVNSSHSHFQQFQSLETQKKLLYVWKKSCFTTVYCITSWNFVPGAAFYFMPDTVFHTITEFPF